MPRLALPHSSTVFNRINQGGVTPPLPAPRTTLQFAHHSLILTLFSPFPHRSLCSIRPSVSTVRPIRAGKPRPYRPIHLFVSDSLSPLTAYRLPITDHRLPITDYRLPLLYLHTAPSRFPTVHSNYAKKANLLDIFSYIWYTKISNIRCSSF